MKFHVLPIPQKLTPEELENRDLHKSFNKFKQEMTTTHKKLVKKEAETYKDLIYLFDKKSMEKLVVNLKDGDEIIIHGEGNPFIIGLTEPSQYDLTAYELAEMLDNNDVPDVKADVNLLICNSASSYCANPNTKKATDFNFAKDCSEALNICHDYNNLTVTGYTGMVKVNNNAKYSVTSAEIKDTKGTHANLENASMTYNNGDCIKEGRILSDLSNEDYGFATSYIEKAKTHNTLVAETKMTKQTGKFRNLLNEQKTEQQVEEPTMNVGPK